MRLSLLFVGLVACKASEPTPPVDTDTDTPVAGEAGLEVTGFAILGDPGPTWSVLHNELLGYDIEGTWGNSEACADCGAALLVEIGSTPMTCVDLDSAGPAPGAALPASLSSTAFATPGEHPVRVLLVEGVTCTALDADVSPLVGALRAEVGTLTVALDTSMVVETTSATTRVDPRGALVANLFHDIDVAASTADITLTGPDGDVPIDVTLDGRLVRVEPIDALEEFRTAYTLRIDGLVAENGAVMPGPWSQVFTTLYFDEQSLYRVYSVEHGSDVVLTLQADETTRLEDAFLNDPMSLWYFVATPNDSFSVRSQWYGDAQALSVSGSGSTPTMVATNSSSGSQRWRVTPGTDFVRLSVEAYTDAVVLQASTVYPNPPVTMAAIDGTQDGQRWRFVYAGDRTP